MQHKVKVTVIDKKLYPELQREYCMDPASGACPVYNVGDEYVFSRYSSKDDFWHIGLDTLSFCADPDGVAGGKKFPHCSEAWDAIARYIYRTSGRQHHARLDEGPEADDRLLFGRHAPSHIQNRTP